MSASLLGVLSSEAEAAASRVMGYGVLPRRVEPGVRVWSTLGLTGTVVGEDDGGDRLSVRWDGETRESRPLRAGLRRIVEEAPARAGGERPALRERGGAA